MGSAREPAVRSPAQPARASRRVSRVGGEAMATSGFARFPGKNRCSGRFGGNAPNAMESEVRRKQMDDISSGECDKDITRYRQGRIAPHDLGSHQSADKWPVFLRAEHRVVDVAREATPAAGVSGFADSSRYDPLRWMGAGRGGGAREWVQPPITRPGPTASSDLV